MVVNEENFESDDAALYISQAGFDWKTGPVTWTLAGSYYHWDNLQSTEWLHNAQYKKGGGNTFVDVDPGPGTVLQYRYDYTLWEGLAFLNFKLGPVPATLIFDCILNTADHVPSDQDTAYYAGFELGSHKKKGDWSLAYKYARIERDALIGSLNDQDFYGANRKGHKIKLRYMLHDRVELGTAFFYTDPITTWGTPATNPNFDNDRDREHEDRLQVDLILKF
jgi:hypothetical protein